MTLLRLTAAIALSAALASPARCLAADPADPDAFPPSDRLSLGLALDAGHKRYGNQVGAVGAARFHGAILGLSWARMTAGSNGAGATTAAGLVVGFGHAVGPWRAELTGGWGGVSAEFTSGGFPFGSSTSITGGHYLVGRLGIDRRLFGSDGWAVSAGLGAWYQRVTQSGVANGWNELGYGVRLGTDFGL